MQTQRRAAVWLLAATALGAGCTSTSTPKRYPLPYIGTRVTPRIRHTAATVGVSDRLERRVGRGGVSSNVGQEDAVRTWGLENAAYAPVGRGPSTGSLSGSQEAPRSVGVDSAATSPVGLSRSPSTVGMGSSPGRIAGVDRGD